LSITAPWVLGDQNGFLRNFVNQELLGVLGVILAITLASAGQLHLQFNEVEDAIKRDVLSRSRAAIKRSAFSLVILFGVAVIIIVAKPHVVGDIACSFINSLALLILLFNLLVLTDLTQTVFAIPPLHKLKPPEER